MKVTLTHIIEKPIQPCKSFFYLVIIVFQSLYSLQSYGQSPYCNASFTSQSGNCTTYGMSINAVEIRQGSNIIYSRAHNSGGYNGCTASTGEYTLWSNTPMFKLKAGGNYKIGFTTGPTYSVGVGVWIDLNRDNDFADSGEWRSNGWCTPYLTPGSSSLQYFNLTIPYGVDTGKTRMRIRTTYNSCTVNDNGCSSYSYGESEDYTIQLTSYANDAGITNLIVPRCDQTLRATVTNLGLNNVDSLKIGWTVNGQFQSNNSYKKQLTKGTSDEIILSPNFNFKDAAFYTIKVFTFSPNSKKDADPTNDTSTISFTYSGPAQTPEVLDAFRCGIGSVLLKTKAIKNNYSLWYGSQNGNTILAIDSTYTTPKLRIGVTSFYVESAKLSKDTVFSTGLSAGSWFGNIQSGNMFDMVAKKSLILDSFALNINNFNKIKVDVYVKNGSYKGFQKDSKSWTLIKSVSNIQAKGIGKATIINMDEFLMPAGTYGVYVDVSEGILFNSGYKTVETDDILYQGGDAISGSFNTILSNYSWAGNLYYRAILCNSARVPVSVKVYPSPYGASFKKSIPFQTKKPQSLGTISDPDIVVSGDTLTYEIVTPVGYTQNSYGKLWTTSNFTITTKSGIKVPDKYYTFISPDKTSPGKLIFKPDSSLEDSLIKVQLNVSDLGPYYCDSSITRYIFQAPLPRIRIEYPTNICDGDTVLFKNNSDISSGGFKSYWNFGTGNKKDTSNSKSGIFTFPKFGTYDVSLTLTSIPYGYSSSKKIKVYVSEIPITNFKVVNACENVPVQLLNTTTFSGVPSYQWFFGDPNRSDDNSISENTAWKYSQPGVYQVTLIAEANGCKSELTKNVNQFASPKANFNVPTQLCERSQIQFTNLSTIRFGNIGYTWDFGDGSISNLRNPIHVFKDTQTLNVKMKSISEFGCLDSISKTLKFKESPIANFQWEGACNLAPTQFNFTGKETLGSLTSYLWTFDQFGSSNLVNPEILFSIPGKKKIQLKLISKNGCADSLMKEIDIKLQAKADFKNSDVCEDDDAVFTNMSKISSGNLSYIWKFGDGFISTAQSPRHKYAINGITQTFNVLLVALVPGGCSDSIFNSITVNASPSSDFNYKVSGRLVEFNAVKNDAQIYQWRFGDGGSSIQKNTSWHYLNFPSGNYKACLALVDESRCFSETCKMVSISGGIDVPKIKGNIAIYPNPSSGKLNIKTEDPNQMVQIKLYDLNGKLLSELNNGPISEKLVLDLQYEDGIYILQISTKGQVYYEKIMLNK